MATPVSWQSPDPEGGPAPGVDFASPGGRPVAYIIDGLVQFGLAIVFLLVGTVLLAIFWPLGVIAYVAAGLFLLLYFPYFWQKSGQTLGMKMMQIKVVRDADGGPIGWGPAILRFIGFYGVGRRVLHRLHLHPHFDKAAAQAGGRPHRQRFVIRRAPTPTRAGCTRRSAAGGPPGRDAAILSAQGGEG